MLGPGKRTNEPVPKEIVGYFCADVDRRKCASMDLVDVALALYRAMNKNKALLRLEGNG